jgi:heme/copper-type cytochrome/quinol oxidase subunit 3
MVTIIDSSSFAPGSMSRSRERAHVDVAVDLGRSRYHVPGEAGIWIFIFGDITLYALLSACFMLDRRKNPSLFDQAANSLHTTFGAVNAFLLLTSSLLVALGVRAVHEHIAAHAPALFAADFRNFDAFLKSARDRNSIIAAVSVSRSRKYR